MPDVVIIGNRWDASRDNPTSKHQVALALSRKGHRVLWVDGAGMRRPALGSGGDRAKIAGRISTAIRGAEEVAENIWRVAPLIIPLPSSSAARRINESIYLRAIRRASGKLGFSSPLLINFLPTIPGIFNKWREVHHKEHREEAKTLGRHAITIYYCVDKWGQFAGHDARLLESLNRECCKNADVVLASAQDLYDECSKHNKKTVLMPHGVEHAHFAKALRKGMSHTENTEAQRGKNLGQNEQNRQNGGALRRIGFFGLIDERMDPEVLAGLAALEGTELVLAGKADNSAPELPDSSNVILPGPVPYAQLPELIATFDVGIIPYKVNELTHAINPIKLREMLAAGCPVVSTDLPEVRRLAETLPKDAVSVASDKLDFIQRVSNALARHLSLEERKSISNSMLSQDWSVKVEEILSLLGEQRENE